MKIKIRLFGHLSALLKDEEKLIEIPDGSLVGDVPSVIGVGQKDISIFFVGHDRVDRDHVLTDGDVLKLIPPITGG